MIFSSEGGNTFAALKSLRALRALRPLRILAKDESMRLIVNALMTSLPAIGNVMIVYSLFLLVFGIMFIYILKGRFWFC